MKTLFRTFPIKIQPRQLATEIKRNHTIIPPSLSLSFSPLTLEHALVKELLTSVQKFRDKFKIGTEFPPLYLSKPQKEKKKNGGSQINWNLRGDFYFYFAQLHCAQIRLSSIARYREGNLYKEEGGENFGPIWYFFLFSNQSLFSSPHLHTDSFVPSSGNWRLSRFTLSPLPSLSTIHGFRGQILDRERGGLVAFSRYLRRNCSRMDTRRADRTKEIRRWSINLGGKFGYSDVRRLTIRVLRLIRKRRDNICTRLLITWHKG